MPTDQPTSSNGPIQDRKEVVIASSWGRGKSEDELSSGLYEGFDDEPRDDGDRAERRDARREPPRRSKFAEYDVDTLHLAREQGFSDDQILSYKPQQLDALTAKIEQRAGHRARSIRESIDAGREREERKPQQPIEEPEYEIDWGERDDQDPDGRPVKKKLTDEDINPGVAKTLRHALAEIKSLKKKLGIVDELDQRDKARTEASYRDVIDSAIADLGPGYARILGDGGLEELFEAKDNKSIKLRGTLIAAAREAGLDLGKNPSVSKVKKLVQSAAKELFGHLAGEEQPRKKQQRDAGPSYGEGDDDVAREDRPRNKSGQFTKIPAHDAEVDDDEDDRRRKDAYEYGGMAQPSHRKLPERTGFDAAVDGVREFKEENGFTSRRRGDRFET